MQQELETADIQSLIVRGYGKLLCAEFLRMRVRDPESGAALARQGLRALLEFITFGEQEPGQELELAANIAFTAEGLSHLGLDEEIRDSFPAAFLEGMHTRERILGDRSRDWQWGKGDELPDAILLVFGEHDDTTKRAAEILEQAAAGWLCTRLPSPRPLFGPGQTGATPVLREHFGFADGIGNPTIRGLGQDRPENEVAPGEFLLGYPNQYGRLPASPSVDPGGGKGVVLPNGDFGRNGSYLVFRQLAQEVYKFWEFLLEQSGGKADEAVALAAKMVGRWPNGAPLARWSAYQPDGDRRKDDDFLYAGDRNGFGCPIGSHIRRTNPRDAVPQLDAERSIASTKHRRLLRRGRTYGPPVKAWPQNGEPWPDPRAIVEAGDDQVDRGVHFLCFCANLVDQYEFVQQSWVSSRKFGGLANDADPLLSNPHVPAGAKSSGFTLQREPVNRRIEGLPAFVAMKGGAYFFMPGMRALHFLTEL